MGWGALESLRGRPSQLDAIEAVRSGGWAEVEEACGVGFYVGRRGQCFIVGQGSGGAGWRVVQRATSPESGVARLTSLTLSARSGVFARVRVSLFSRPMWPYCVVCTLDIDFSCRGPGGLNFLSRASRRYRFRAGCTPRSLTIHHFDRGIPIGNPVTPVSHARSPGCLRGRK